MDRTELRKADFKTGLVLVAFCLWFLAITFVFMPFRETYGGVDNVWYVSPWIFPAVVLSLLLVLAVVLIANAAMQGGHRDVVRFPRGTVRSFRLTPLGMVMAAVLAAACAGGLWYMVVSIQAKIDASLEEARWLADPSRAQVFHWSDPLAVAPVAGLLLVVLAAVAALAVSLARHRRDARPAVRTAAPGPGEPLVRFAVIAVLFCVLVYVLVPNVDFVLAVLLFLTTFTVAFHVEDATVLRRIMGVYVSVGVGVAGLFLTGLDAAVNAPFAYATDALVFAATLGCTAWIWRCTAGAPEQRRRLRTCLVISWVTPLVLAPVFRFGLLVPLPYEGGAVELMHRLRYLLQ